MDIVAGGQVDDNRQYKVDKRTSIDNQSGCERKMDMDKSESGYRVWKCG